MPNLAISLHAPTDAIRGELVPLNRKYGVADIIAACKRFPLKRRSRITFEYVMLAGVNDSPDDARRLAKLCRGREIEGQSDSAERGAGYSVRTAVRRGVDRFAQILADHHLTVSVRKSRGPRHPRRMRTADRRRRGRSPAQQLATLAFGE